MNKIVASLVVSCGVGVREGEHIVVELDDVLNNDKRSFDSGDIIYFRIQHSPDVVLQKMEATDGSIFANGSVSRAEKDQLLWIDVQEPQNLSYIPFGTLSELWYGHTGSGLRRIGLKQVQLASVESPALVRIDYSSSFLSFKLIAPIVDLSAFEDATYPVTVVATFEAV